MEREKLYAAALSSLVNLNLISGYFDRGKLFHIKQLLNVEIMNHTSEMGRAT